MALGISVQLPGKFFTARHIALGTSRNVRVSDSRSRGRLLVQTRHVGIICIRLSVPQYTSYVGQALTPRRKTVRYRRHTSSLFFFFFFLLLCRLADCHCASLFGYLFPKAAFLVPRPFYLSYIHRCGRNVTHLIPRGRVL